MPQSQITSVSGRFFIGIACMRLDITAGLKILCTMHYGGTAKTGDKGLGPSARRISDELILYEWRVMRIKSMASYGGQINDEK